MRVLYVSLFLEIRKEAPAQQAHGKFGVASCTVLLNFLDELPVFRRVHCDDIGAFGVLGWC